MFSLHGYDLEKQQFKIAGFFSDPPVYAHNRSIDFSLLKSSFEYASPIKQRMNQILELVRFPHDFFTVSSELEMKYIIRSFEEHLSSKTLAEKNPKRIDYWFGMRVYELLVKFLELELQGKTKIHLKAFQTLINHKRLMLVRIKYLHEHKYIKDPRLIVMCEEILNRTRVIHNLYIKHKLVKDRKITESIIVNTQALHTFEKKFVEYLLEDLNKSVA